MKIFENAEVKYKTISDFSDYFVDKYGNIYTKKGVVTKKLKPGVGARGYFVVTLCKNGKTYTRRVHKLVLETFVGPCPFGMECCRKDGDKQNNNLSNLYYRTKSENDRDKKRHGTDNVGEKQGNSKLSEKEVLEIRELYNLGYPQTKIASMFNVSQGHVCNIMKRRMWKHI